jgi:hypothetical protein
MQKLSKAAAVTIGVALCLVSVYVIIGFHTFLRWWVKRPGLYNIDVAPVDPDLFWISACALCFAIALVWLILSSRLKTVSKPKLALAAVLLLLSLVPLKNSALQHTLFFAFAGPGSVLIFVAGAGMAQKSLSLLSRGRGKIMAMTERNWMVLIFLLSLVFYALAAVFLFSRIPHTLDEMDYLFHARTFEHARLWAPVPAPIDFFRFTNIIAKDGRWFSQYPPAWPALLLVGLKLGAPWLVNPVLGACLTLVIYLFGLEFFGKETARLGSVLAVFSPYQIIMNSGMMSHTSCALFSILFLLLLRQGLERGSMTRAFFALLCLGLAVAVRPFSAFLVALPGALLMAARFFQAPLKTVKLLPAAALGLAIPIALLLYYNRLTTGSALLFGYQYLNGRAADLGFGMRQFPFPHTFLEGLVVLHSRMVLISEKLLETTVPSLALAALAFIYGKRDFKLYWMALVFLSLPVGHIFYFGNDMCYPPRYLFESVPALLILCAAGIKAAGEKWGANPEVAHFGLVVAALAFFIFIPSQILSYRRAGDIGPDLEQAIEHERLQGSLVLIENLYYPMGMIRQSPFLDGDNIYARDLADRRQELFKQFPSKPVWNFYRDPKTQQFVLKPLQQAP